VLWGEKEVFFVQSTPREPFYKTEVISFARNLQAHQIYTYLITPSIALDRYCPNAGRRSGVIGLMEKEVVVAQMR